MVNFTLQQFVSGTRLHCNYIDTTTSFNEFITLHNSQTLIHNIAQDLSLGANNENIRLRKLRFLVVSGCRRKGWSWGKDMGQEQKKKFNQEQIYLVIKKQIGILQLLFTNMYNLTGNINMILYPTLSRTLRILYQTMYSRKLSRISLSETVLNMCCSRGGGNRPMH